MEKLNLKSTQELFFSEVYYNQTLSDGLNVYRNNIYAGLTKNLRLTYPNIVSLIGEDCFNQTAAIYLQNFPSKSYNILDIGKNFAEFLRTFKPLDNLPYLSEMAMLEWAYQQVFYAKNFSPLNLEDLKKIPEADYADLKLALHPATKLLIFNYPIFEIWELCKNQNNLNIDLSSGGDKILLFRSEFQIQIKLLTLGEYEFLVALNNNQTLETACGLALDAQPELNINLFLQKAVLWGIFVGASDFKL